MYLSLESYFVYIPNYSIKIRSDNVDSDPFKPSWAIFIYFISQWTWTWSTNTNPILTSMKSYHTKKQCFCQISFSTFIYLTCGYYVVKIDMICPVVTMKSLISLVDRVENNNIDGKNRQSDIVVTGEADACIYGRHSIWKKKMTWSWWRRWYNIFYPASWIPHAKLVQFRPAHQKDQIE